MAERSRLDSTGPSMSRQERIAENRTDQSTDGNETKVFAEISKRLSSEECQMFGIKLGLSINVLMDLEKECSIYQFGREFKIVRMLEKWKSKTNPDENQLVSFLAETLRTVDRNDIADSIEQKFHHGSHDTFSDLQNEMTATQKSSFKFFLLPRDLWLTKKRLRLEELYVKLTMMRKSEMGEMEQEKEIGIEEIFDKIDSKVLRRILIEGQPGYGKTTLITKLLSDWSKGKNYISDRFHLVFVIALRTLKGDLSSHFLQQCERVEGSEDVKLKAIKAIEERVLLLLDGLDEIPTGNKENLYRLFKGEDYPLMTVVVTCRTGFLPKVKRSDNTFQASVNKGFEMDFIWDKRIEIQGISYWDRISFIQKYLNIDYEKVKRIFYIRVFLLNEMYECPLFLLLLAVLIQEKEIREIKTKTELYKTIFNFVINRGLDKLKGNKKEIDVFDLKSETDEFGCRNLLLNFGRLCLDKMKKQSLMFEESELLKCSDGNGDQDLILKLGFISKQISFSNYEEMEHYEPIHRSFLEFSAAFFLSSFDGMEREIQELVSKYDICPKEDQLLYPFLGGLLNYNVFKLFKALSPYKWFISIFTVYYDYDNVYRNVENVLLEIPQTEEIIKSLENLLIHNWETVIYRKSLHGWYVGLLKYCRKVNEVMTLEVLRFSEIINDCSDIKINTIQVDVDKYATTIRCRNIQCRNLKITMMEPSKDSVLIFKEFITNIKADKVWIKIHSHYNDTDVLIIFFKEISHVDFQQFNFYHLLLELIPPSSWCLISPYIEDLIKQRKIEFGVHVGFKRENYSFKKEFSSFVETVFNSHLQSFSVDHFQGNEPLPFPITSFDSENQMQLIQLSEKFEVISDDEMNSISVEHLKCHGLLNSFSLKLLKKCKNMKRLSCNSELICLLGDDDSFCEWKGFETIVRLELYERYFLNEESFLKGISLFQSLQEVYLCQGFTDIEKMKFIAVLPSLKKIRFYHADFGIIKQLLVLNEQRGERGLSLDELEIFSPGYSFLPPMDIIKCIEECFLKNVFFQLSILCPYKYELKKVFTYFSSKDDYKLASHVTETHPYDEKGLQPRCKIKLSLQKLR